MGGKQLRPTDVKRLNRSWRRRTHGRVAVLLDSVTAPFNVGSIIRSAAAFGTERVWFTGNSTPPTHPSVRKTSLGTERLLPWEQVSHQVAAAERAREDGFRLVAVELTVDALPLHEAPLSGDVCLALGNEDHGCSPRLLQAVDAVAYIPQIGRVGSFNVAVAAAIGLAEIRRQEWAGG